MVNIGELLEIASNGYLRATVHRVVSPPANRERVSIAFSSVRSWTPKYRCISCRRSWRQAHGPTSDPDNPLLREVGWNYLKGRLRSHRDVAQRYYADALSTVKS